MTDIAKVTARLVCNCLIATAFLTSAHALAGDRDDRNDRGRSGDCRKLVALTADRTLMNLRECEPTYGRNVRVVVGLTGSDTTLVGIDYRVQDNKLYGVGNAGGIYVIDPSTGNATKSRQLTVALEGASFGVDFNPAADALRIVSNTGQNLRHPFADPAAATVVDGALNYTAGTTAMGIGGAAYINNDLAAETGTFLFDIDATLNQLALQVPPNSGGLIRIGALTVDPDAAVGFDIYSELRAGITKGNTGYATFSVGGVVGLYKINLLTGKANRLGIIREPVVDLAVPLDQD